MSIKYLIKMLFLIFIEINDNKFEIYIKILILYKKVLILI